MRTFAKSSLLLLMLWMAACGGAPAPQVDAPPPGGVLSTPLVATAISPQVPPPEVQPPSPVPSPTSTLPPTSTPTLTPPLRFAIIGDYGDGGQGEAAVAALVDSWSVDFILTAGDNNYTIGAADTIDEHIGQFYHAYIAPYQGGYGQGAQVNRFFPVPGNHDWGTGSLSPYLDYFSLPGNERYYTFTQGAVTFFMLDSDWSEPDGNTADSVQAAWLQNALAHATTPWKIVVLHHPPYSSGRHGDNTFSQWPFAQWGADAVIGGHDHTYERILRDGIVYFVNGIGGAWRYDFNAPVEGSRVRFNAAYGAMLVEADAAQVTFQFITVDGDVVDTWSLQR